MIVAILGLFFGALAMMMIPYLRKLREGEIDHFDKKFLASFAGSIVFAAIVTVFLIPNVSLSGGVAERFANSFILGIGSNALFAELLKFGIEIRNGGS